VTPAALAVDAGQSETRAALLDERGSRVVATGPGVARMDGAAIGPDDVAATLLRTLEALDAGPEQGRAAAARGALPEGIPALGVGLSGFESAAEEDLARIAEVLRRATGAERIALASDGVTSLLGALGERPGAVVAAGTGTVAVAHDGRRWAKVDAWGSLLGDAGSGFAIGRAGLDAALRCHDGRGGSEALREAAVEAFGRLDELPLRVHRAPSPSARVASFAREVARAAAAGDRTAAAIVADAGRELARSTAAALGRLFRPGGVAAVACTGKVFLAGPPLTEAFAAALEELRPGTEVVEASGDSLAGAAMLAERAGELRAERGLIWTDRASLSGREASGAGWEASGGGPERAPIARREASGGGPERAPIAGRESASAGAAGSAPTGRRGPASRDPFAAMRGGLVVSAQAPSGSPLRDPSHMAAMAHAAEVGGARGIRAEGAGDVAAIKAAVDLPVIGLRKRELPGTDVYITPELDDARELAGAGADAIALDATLRARPGGVTAADLIASVRAEVGLPLLADVDSVEAGLAARAAGAEAVATTLSGYTGGAAAEAPDLELVRRLAAELDCPVLAEGRYASPAAVSAAFDAGAFAVIVGTAITDPVALTRSFAAAAPG
jgi:N-acylglucosamine-6-phosphate 2-epimerase